MSVAKNIEISSTSNESFEDAINRGIERASRSLKNVTSAWIKEQKINLETTGARGYQVIMIVTFVLDDNDDNGDEDEASGGGKRSGGGRGKKK